MTTRIYAMDTHFWCANRGPSAREQAEMVKSAGYDDYYVTGSINNVEGFREYMQATSETGLGWAAAFDTIDISKPPTPEKLAEAETVIRSMKAPSRLEIAMVNESVNMNVGDASKDDLALAWLEPLSTLLEKHGIEMSLYPHFGFYLETFSDALRLVEKIASPKVKAIFCAYHWFRVNQESAKEPGYAELFARAGRRLNAVNLCGSRSVPSPEEPCWNGLNPSIEPLDAGTMDVAGMIADLKRTSYSGPIGVQGYGVTAPAGEALLRSHAELKRLLDR